jgi:hypothetical protein
LQKRPFRTLIQGASRKALTARVTFATDQPRSSAMVGAAIIATSEAESNRCINHPASTFGSSANSVSASTASCQASFWLAVFTIASGSRRTLFAVYGRC